MVFQNYQQNYTQPQQGGYQAYQQPQQGQAADLGSVADFGMGGGAKSAFNSQTPVGATVRGTIEDMQVMQITDFQTHAPQFWGDGKPKKQLRIIIAADVSPEDEDDDCRRAIYIKEWGVQLRAYREAIRLNGGKAPKKGDLFTATYVGVGQRGNAPQPPKLYEYKIEAGTPSEVASFGTMQQAAQQAQPVQPVHPVQPVVQADIYGTTYQANMTSQQIAQIRQLAERGMTSESIAAQLRLTVQQVNQARTEQEPEF